MADENVKITQAVAEVIRQLGGTSTVKATQVVAEVLRQLEGVSVVKVTQAVAEAIGKQTWWTDFSEYAHNEAPAEWPERWRTDYFTRKVINASQRRGGKILQIDNMQVSTRHTACEWTSVPDDLADVDIVASVRPAVTWGGTSWGGIVARGGDSYTGYCLALIHFKTYGQIIRLAEYTGSQTAHTNLKSSYWRWYPAQDTDTHRYWWLRLNVTGTTIKGKVWPDNQIEPDDWHIQATDSTLTSGWVGVCRTANYISRYNWYDWFAVGINGQTAPTPEMLWPKEGYDEVYPPAVNITQQALQVIGSGSEGGVRETQLALQVIRQAHPPHQTVSLDDLTGVLSVEPVDAQVIVPGKFVFKIPTTM